MQSMKIDVNMIADYICWKVISEGSSINVTKLHKLLYLVQAWFMVNNDKALFDDDFEAWSHGPVCRTIYDRYNHKLPTATPIQKNHIDMQVDQKLHKDVKTHINNVLKDFGDLSFLKLEEFFHEHDLAFKKTRGKLTPTMQSNKVITKEEILDFFKNHYKQE
jgi:uncharacterized phage-associated protein